ncbi:MAG: HlyD family type I secretion membrane fusion protein [Psychrobacter glaciei]|jgi:HlyD family type I secretion membrane fusion protein
MQIILAPPAPYKLEKLNIVGTLIILFGVVGGLLWAAFTPLDSAIVALGKVKVQSERKQIQHLEGGMVKTIVIQDGDRVEEGQLLLTLDATFANSDVDRVSAQWHELKIRESVLLAQRDRIREPYFPAEILHTAESSWINHQMVSAINGFKISESNLKSQLDILKNQSFQLTEQISGIELEVEAKEEQLTYVNEEMASWKTLFAQKLANKLRYLELQRGGSELKGEIAQLKSQASSLRVKFSEIEFKSLRVQQDYREKAAKELAEVQLNLNDSLKRMGTANNVLKRIEIRSPVSGTIVGLNIHTLGAVIKPGETILEVVPEKDKLIIEARVKPMDVDKVYKSLQSRIKISSYKVHEFPEFDGVVEWVSADVFEDPQTLESFYLARIVIPEASFSQLPSNKIQPGMPSEVLIKTGESTPLQYLMEPLLSAFRTAWRDQ